MLQLQEGEVIALTGRHYRELRREAPYVDLRALLLQAIDLANRDLMEMFS